MVEIMTFIKLVSQVESTEINKNTVEIVKQEVVRNQQQYYSQQYKM